MASLISQRRGQFAIVDEQLGHPNWAGKKVLDFGGNVGNVLLDADCTIEPKNYWSVDVSKYAILEGRRRHPDAHFVCYDRFNCQYNPTGTPDLPIPDLGTSFDYVISRSVITHLSRHQAVELIAELRGRLAPGGVLAMTFLDPHWVPPPGWARYGESPERSNLRYRLDLALTSGSDVDVEAVAKRAETSDSPWMALISGTELITDPEEALRAEEKPQISYVSFCTTAHMVTMLSGARIRPPVQLDRLHCAIVQND